MATPWTATFTFVLIPCTDSQEIEERTLSNAQIDYDSEANEVGKYFGLFSSVRLSTLLRPRDGIPGLYAYSSSSDVPNIRATRLAMACGLLSLRLKGDILLFRHFSNSLFKSDIYGAAVVSPDLRELIQEELGNTSNLIPDWLRTAPQQNYHDLAALKELNAVMSVSDSFHQTEKCNLGREREEQSSGSSLVPDVKDETGLVINREFVTDEPLCLQCRGPSSTLCPDCDGVYFCAPPRTCRQQCWSHDCVCATWKCYTDRRDILKGFSFDCWHLPLLTRDNELSEEPFKLFLNKKLGLRGDGSSWWRTETDGWQGGDSLSAKTVDPSIRYSYAQGFHPLRDIPPQRRPNAEEVGDFVVNELGFLKLQTWKDYYQLRGIPLSSEVALLLTFPLTVYHAIATFGDVPVTVARMLNRPLRIHLVGVEKELNFLDIFQECGFLVPESIEIELVLIVRHDMLPPKAQATLERVKLTTNLTVHVVSGTYGSNDLDPNFDCGSGSPDMIIGLNAGLFAYDSWRGVIEYLEHYKGVVGVFTDYNEHSGMNCAALGGASVLHINPFRQPRAMPVYSMNLPQFSNGFIYVYNEQYLD